MEVHNPDTFPLSAVGWQAFRGLAVAFYTVGVIFSGEANRAPAKSKVYFFRSGFFRIAQTNQLLIYNTCIQNLTCFDFLDVVTVSFIFIGVG